MSQPTNSFRTLAGVPVHYDRDPAAPYGTHGRPATFYCTQNFEDILDRCFQELWEVSGLGAAQVITSAGAYVNKPGMHGLGEAFDLDGIFWAGKNFVTSNFPSDRRFYLAVEAVLRKHFGTVLNYHFNAAHRDHLHIDTGKAVGFSRAQKSKVLFVQSVLTNMLEIPVEIDGVWGDETANGISSAAASLGIVQEFENRDTWLEFLTVIARRGFQTQIHPRARSAEELLRDVYSVINHELAAHPARKTIETAVTTFVNHPAVKKAVEFRGGDGEANERVEGGDSSHAFSPHEVSVRFDDGENKWFARIDGGDEFYVGKEVTYLGRRGLQNLAAGAMRYKPEDYREKYKFWADFIYPTAVCEGSCSFHCLNTYDRAYFTFGFLQFAAHTYNGDFARYFRALLALPEAKRYFPELEVRENAIFRGSEKLESNVEVSPLMKYLNPTTAIVENVEVRQAARFIHWTQNSLAHRNLQVEVGIKFIKEKLRVYAERYGLNGMRDDICLVIMDIHHQGRGTVQEVRAALETNGNGSAALSNLLQIGAAKHAPRLVKLRGALEELPQGTPRRLGIMNYDTTINDFVSV